MCIFIYIYISIYINIHIYIYVYTQIYMDICKYIYIQNTYIYIYMYTCIYIYIYILLLLGALTFESLDSQISERPATAYERVYVYMQSLVHQGSRFESQTHIQITNVMYHCIKTLESIHTKNAHRLVALVSAVSQLFTLLREEYMQIVASTLDFFLKASNILCVETPLFKLATVCCKIFLEGCQVRSPLSSTCQSLQPSLTHTLTPTQILSFFLPFFSLRGNPKGNEVGPQAVVASIYKHVYIYAYIYICIHIYIYI